MQSDDLARFGLDAVDLDMLKSGDMLGSKTGPKFYAAIERLVAEMDEAREALKPFDRLGSIVMAEAPENAKTVVCFTSASGEQFAMQLDYFRRARQALKDAP